MLFEYLFDRLVLLNVGGALYAMLEFFQSLVATKTPGLGFQDLLHLISLPIYSPKETQGSSTYAVHKQVCVDQQAISKHQQTNNIHQQTIHRHQQTINRQSTKCAICSTPTMTAHKPHCPFQVILKVQLSATQGHSEYIHTQMCVQ